MKLRLFYYTNHKFIKTALALTVSLAMWLCLLWLWIQAI